jgi:tetratricopeptide (TPR) repeat protein
MYALILIALLTGAFALSTALEAPLRQWSRRGQQPQGALQAMLGDSRRLFASHFFVQSDVYLHGGYYPSIFDSKNDEAKKEEELHEGEREDGHAPKAHEHQDHSLCSHDFLGKPRNWIDAFGRNFYPSRHTHLDEKEAAGAREILPLMRLSAELDPQRVETYTVAAYWLRQMGKIDEALQFLREGLRANPDSHEILFELGVCYETKADIAMARNLWELAFKRWEDNQAGREQPDKLAGAQILTRLTRLEVRSGHRDQAVAHLERFKLISPAPDRVQLRIAEVKAGQPFEADGVK